MSSLYADYLKEKEGFDIIETEYGFISFQIRGDVAVGRDFYIKNDERSRGMAKQLWKLLEQHLSENGVRKFYTSVPCARSDATRLVKIYLRSTNAKIVDARDGCLIMEIEIYV